MDNYKHTFIVEVSQPSMRAKLAKHGKVGKPQSLTTTIIFKTNLEKDEVEKMTGVIEVEEETIDIPSATPFVQRRPASWFLPSASNTAPDYYFYRTGTGVAIYIMDSGIRLDHKDFEGRHIETVFSYDGLDYGGGVVGPEHGTMAASCAAGNEHGIAKGASIFNLRYNWTSTEGIKALDTMYTHYLSHNMPAILSMSFSASSNIYDRIFTQLANSGVMLVAAAGNYDEPHPRFPALRDDVIAVAACDELLRPAWWGGTATPGTNYGPEIDVWAGGSDGIAAGITTQSSTQWAGGTSSACPIVAGALALELEGYSKLVNYQEVLDTKAVFLQHTRKDVIKYGDKKYATTPNRYVFTLIEETIPAPTPEPTPDPTPIPDPVPTPEPTPSEEKSSNLPLILGAIVVVGLIVLLAL